MENFKLVMNITLKAELLHHRIKQNRWMRYFTVFVRLVLALGFLPAGVVKIAGERFASGLSVNHPMGHYLEALHHTGYYYTWIGILQIIAAVLLLIPRTVLLGALIYFPIILNICILSYAVRFEGSMFTSPLMVLGSLYLLCWNYDKLKFILPFDHHALPDDQPKVEQLSNKFPTLFFTGVAGIIAVLVLILMNPYYIRPRNSLKDCREQFKGTNRTTAGYEFCDCIHKRGEPLNPSLNKYYKAADDTISTR